jgi:hypothetical protein
MSDQNAFCCRSVFNSKTILDFRLQRAAIHYFSSAEAYEKEIEINEATLETLPTDQDRFRLVIGQYLAVFVGE